jgi:hypothetical protein
MRTIEVKIYQFNELSDVAKEKARDWYREGIELHNVVFEPAESAAKLLGITFAKRSIPLMNGKTRSESDIRYSGFSSQGDGASFVGTYEYRQDAPQAVRAEFPEDTVLHRIADELEALQAAHDGDTISARVSQSGTYVHKFTMRAEIFVGEDNAEDELAESILGTMRDFAQWIYDYLFDEWEYQLSDEAVDESITANEYEFLSTGKPA